MTYRYPIRVNDFQEPADITVGENGIATGRARIARAGIQIYFIDGRRVRVLRRPEVVRDTSHLFRDLPVTLNHPSNEDGGEVNASNKERLTKGWGSATEYIAGWLETPVKIVSDEAIAAARTTHRYFSNGYKALLMDGDREWDRVSDPKGGIWVDVDGLVSPAGTEHPYDVEQIPIAGNHIALVLNGTARAGDGATFIDGEEFIEIFTDVTPNPIPKKTMALDPKFLAMAKGVADMAKACGYGDTIEIEIGGEDDESGESYSVPSSMSDFMSAYDGWLKSKTSDSFVDSTTYDAALEDARKARSELDDARKTIGKLNTEKTVLAQQLSDAKDPKQIDSIIAERSESFKKARPFLDHAVEFDATKDAIYWKKEALAAAKVPHEGYSGEQIDVALDTLLRVAPPFQNPLQLDGFGIAPTGIADFDRQFADLRRTADAMTGGDRVLPQNRPVAR